MKRVFCLFISMVLVICMTACSTDSRQPTESTSLDNSQQIDTEPEQESTESTDSTDTKITEEKGDLAEMKMNVKIGNSFFTATLEDNTATRELIEIMKKEPISIDMSDYSGFEKVGPIGRSLTTDNHQTTASAGDIVLYNGNQIVMFYGSNSWSYTRIGKIDDLSGWKDALGGGSITAVFSIAD